MALMNELARALRESSMTIGDVMVHVIETKLGCERKFSLGK